MRRDCISPGHVLTALGVVALAALALGAAVWRFVAS